MLQIRALARIQVIEVNEPDRAAQGKWGETVAVDGDAAAADGMDAGFGDAPWRGHARSDCRRAGAGTRHFLIGLPGRCARRHRGAGYGIACRSGTSLGRPGAARALRPVELSQL